MTQQSLFLPADICSNRHRGNKASREAFKKVDVTKGQAEVLDLVKRAGWKGTTSAEIEKATGKAKNIFSGRISDLKAMGLIYQTGEFRDGCSVLRAK